MASSSHPSSSLSLMNPRNNRKYDVFLSFRGVDTRDNFTSHLHSALCQKSIETFSDDHLIRGDEISESLLDTIEASSISIIIFSERYASSGWCLDELLKILECKHNYGQIVIPVFYRVDPSHVRKQIGIFGKSFSKLEDRFPEKMQRWRSALTEAANLSGFDSLVIRNESELIKKVVDDILDKLPKVVPCDNKTQLIGVELRVGEIESLLGTAPLLGIWGIGGIGKTRVVFSKISRNFEGSCFLQNVREESQSPGGLARLQQKLLSEILKDQNVIPNIDFNFKRLSHRKVLIVLDDVICFRQIEYLIESLDWLSTGSRIIITTRDKQVLKNGGVKENDIYEVKALDYDHALELFYRHAFKQYVPPKVGYKELSIKVTDYAQGVPLALKVLGYFLFGKEKEVWASEISKLKRKAKKGIQEVLKISFDGLDDEEQNIFLDIACFFKDEDKELVIKFLEACGFAAQSGITDLADKSLIVISYNNKITMHDLLQEMGREIVRQESTNNPGERSRLWHHEDIIEVLTSNTGTEQIEGICFDMSKVKKICLNPNTFTNMRKLRYLKIYNSIYKGENKCNLSKIQGPIFAEVRYFHWQGYPLKSLPSNIHPEKIVLLEMPHSSIKQLWDGGVQHHGKLKQIVIAASSNIITKTANPTMIPHLNKLVRLNLSDCSKLKRVPAEISSAGNIKEICLDGTAIKELPSSIECLTGLLRLSLRYCERLKSLPSGLCKLKSLNYLYLSGCKSLKNLPAGIFQLQFLKKLDLWGCSKLKRLPEISSAGNVEDIVISGAAIEELPSSIDCLSRLRSLFLVDCKRLKSLPSSLCKLYSLDYLYLNGCSNLQRFPEALKDLFAKGTVISELPSSNVRLNNVRELYLVASCLDLTDCCMTKLPENLGQLSSLRSLYLSKNNFERIPESIIQLSKLVVLYLNYCERLQSLPMLPCNLRELEAHHCTALESLSGLLSINYGTGFDLGDNFKLDPNEVRVILEDALEKFQLLATAYWKHKREKRVYLERRGYVYLPGNEIPKWFRIQSMGSLVTLKTTPTGWLNNNKVIGFAFSAILSFADHHVGEERSSFLHCELTVNPKDCDSYVIQRYLCQVRNVKSDHLLLGYYLFDDKDLNGFREYNCVVEAVQFNFKKDYNAQECLECWTAKKCGIHLFYPKIQRRPKGKSQL